MASVVGVVELSLIKRSGGLWLLIRSVIAPFAMATGGHPAFLSPSAAVLVIAVCVSLCWIEVWRRHEDVMLANLGTSPWVIAGLVATPALMLEVAVALLRAAA
jgi:hypothetical protein